MLMGCGNRFREFPFLTDRWGGVRVIFSKKKSREKDLNFPQGYTAFYADSEYLNEYYLNWDFSARYLSKTSQTNLKNTSWDEYLSDFI